MQFDMTIPIWGVATLLISLGSLVVAGLANRRKDVDDRIEKTEGVVREHGARIDTIEKEITRLPGDKDIHDLSLQLAALTGSLSQIRESIAGQAEIMRRIETVVSRHEDHLLDGARR